MEFVGTFCGDFAASIFVLWIYKCLSYIFLTVSNGHGFNTLNSADNVSFYTSIWHSGIGLLVHTCLKHTGLNKQINAGNSFSNFIRFATSMLFITLSFLYQQLYEQTSSTKDKLLVLP